MTAYEEWGREVRLSAARQRAVIAAIAYELEELAAAGVALAVEPYLAAWLFSIEDAGGVADLLTGEIFWPKEVPSC